MAKIDQDVSLEKVMTLAALVPMGDPLDPACIWGAVPSIQGPPGVGKTSRAKQVGKTLDMPVGIIELGGRQPEDAGGVPFLTKDDKIVIACLLGVVNELSEVGKGILVLDEINWARPNTQGAFLSMVQDRRVGDTIFSNYIRIMLASNPRKSAGGGHLLIPPMANRVLHFEYDVPSQDDEDSYLMGLTGKTVTATDAKESIIQDKWQDVWPKMVGQMIGFKRKNPEYVMAEPQAGDPKHHHAWPSPRSRELALRCLTTIRILETTTDANGREKLSPLEDLFVEAACGSEMATAWAVYRDEEALPDPLEMLKNGFKPDKRRLDRAFAAYKGVAAYVLGRKDEAERKQLAEPLWELFPTLLDSGLSDVALSVAIPVIRGGLNLKLGGSIAKTIQKVLVEFKKRELDKFIEAEK